MSAPNQSGWKPTAPTAVTGESNGATTTAQTTRSAFALAGGHVDAGAYAYTLHAADAERAEAGGADRVMLATPAGLSPEPKPAASDDETADDVPALQEDRP